MIASFKTPPSSSRSSGAAISKIYPAIVLVSIVVNHALVHAARHSPTQYVSRYESRRPLSYDPSVGLISQARSITVPGSSKDPSAQDGRPELVLPYEDYNESESSASDLMDRSYVIDNKRFVEAFPTRCFRSTVLENPPAVEPQFIIIKPRSEIRFNATAPLSTIRRAGFEAHKPTVVLIHGYTQTYPNTTWLRKVRALFEIHHLVSQYNLIIMDWGTLSHGPYNQVASKVGGVGSFLANFLLKLFDMGADRASIHLVGHSLGGHVAGFAGKRLRPRIGRITALDPAGPCFGKIISNSHTDRLAADDAYEVDIYHYDDGFLGLSTPMGQFDVYVNGGSSQPGSADNAVTVVQAFVTILFQRNRALSESHTRSTEVASSQLSTTGCQEVAYECRDWPAFLSGECGKCDESNEQCFFMGFPFQYANMEPQPLRSSFPGRRYYIATSDHDPYCLHHWQIIVKFEPSPELASHARRNKWRIQLELFNDRNERLNVTMDNQMSSHAFSYLFLSEMVPARMRAAQMLVRSSDGTIVPMNQQQQQSSSTLFRVNNIEINFMSNYNPNIRLSLSSVLCPTSNWLLEPDTKRQTRKEPKKKEDPNEDNHSQLLKRTADNWIGFDECFANGGGR